MTRKISHGSGHTSRRTVLASSLISFFAMSAGASAAVITVSKCSDDGSVGTLRSAVVSASSGDTVDVSQLGLACAAITLQTGQIEIDVDDLTIVGPGREVLAIDGAYNGRVFHHAGAGTLRLQDLTVKHGLADAVAQNPDFNLAGSGGCILSDHGVGSTVPRNGGVLLTDAAVTECRAISDQHPTPSFGGAISATGSVALVRSSVTNSSAATFGGTTWAGGAGGGGIATIYGSVALMDSTVAGNSAEGVGGQVSGGGVYVIANWRSGEGTPLAAFVSANSIIGNNFAGCPSSEDECGDVSAFGGGVFVTNGLSSMMSSVVSNNAAHATSYSAGGGIWSDGGIGLLTTTVSGNAATRSPNVPAEAAVGGGVFAVWGEVLVEASTIDANSAGLGGGLFVADQAMLTVSNSTISANEAAAGGGGIFNGPNGNSPAMPMLLINSTVTANKCGGGQLGGGGIVDMHNAYTSAGFSQFESSIIAGNTNAWPSGNDANLFASSQIIGANNLIDIGMPHSLLPADTILSDPGLGSLQDNGGPTRTHALLWWSPAINAGNNVGGFAFDQRGEGHPRVVNGTADIGAHENGTDENAPPPCCEEIIYRGAFD
jgi:hypothetical protein